MRLSSDAKSVVMMSVMLFACLALVVDTALAVLTHSEVLLNGNYKLEWGVTGAFVLGRLSVLVLYKHCFFAQATQSKSKPP